MRDILENQAQGLRVDEMREWISVKDKLPQVWTHVIIYGPTIEISQGMRCIDVSYTSNPWWRSMKEHYEYDHSSIDDGRVTHWMPLPEPPEEKPDNKEWEKMCLEFEEWEKSQENKSEPSGNLG